MTLDKFKDAVERRTGVPASLLSGETEEEVIARAKALLVLKRESAAKALERTGSTTADHFRDWYATQTGEENNNAGQDPEDTQQKSAGYPQLQDNGEIQTPDLRTARDQFVDWMNGF